MKSFKQMLSETAEQRKEPSSTESAMDIIERGKEKIRNNRFETPFHIQNMKELIDAHTNVVKSLNRGLTDPESLYYGRKELPSMIQDNNKAIDLYKNHIQDTFNDKSVWPTKEEHQSMLDFKRKHAFEISISPSAVRARNARRKPGEAREIATGPEIEGPDWPDITPH